MRGISLELKDEVLISLIREMNIIRNIAEVMIDASRRIISIAY